MRVVWLNERRLTDDSYLILPALYAKDDKQYKLSQAVLSVFVVALLTAGYSFTALLCFACRNDEFQAENVFVYVISRPFIVIVANAPPVQHSPHPYSVSL